QRAHSPSNRSFHHSAFGGPPSARSAPYASTSYRPLPLNVPSPTAPREVSAPPAGAGRTPVQPAHDRDGPLRAAPALVSRTRGGRRGQQVRPLRQAVPGAARAGAAGAGAAAHLALLLLLGQGPGPGAVIVGRVTAVAWPPQQGLAAALADAADRAPPFPGV